MIDTCEGDIEFWRESAYPNLFHAALHTLVIPYQMLFSEIL